MRPYWKGYLKLALVSCPIALHAACSTAERIAFREVNKATGNRLRQQLIDEETREPVAPEHKGRINLVEALRRSVAEDKKTRRVAQGSGPGAQTGMSVMPPRAAMSRPSRVTDSRPHERTR